MFYAAGNILIWREELRELRVRPKCGSCGIDLPLDYVGVYCWPCAVSLHKQPVVTPLEDEIMRIYRDLGGEG